MHEVLCAVNRDHLSKFSCFVSSHVYYKVEYNRVELTLISNLESGRNGPIYGESHVTSLAAAKRDQGFIFEVGKYARCEGA
jgi:hypothetical protein